MIEEGSEQLNEEIEREREGEGGGGERRGRERGKPELYEYFMI
jgi:hypothetical protein